tara:strand:+ start:115 stop:558 length:444 start_codon:yes stop_codon:yes gene_type:complete
VSTSRKSFCVICIANYCRSPVVEVLLKTRFGDKYEFFSAGISPIALPNMDPRSLRYLQENSIKYSFHNPKKINKKMLNYFDKFLAVDPYVLNFLNITYPKYKHKFFLLTKQFNDLKILDPYQMKTNEYLEVMNSIGYVAKKINLEDF